MPHKTTVNLRDDVYVEVMALAGREEVSLGEMVNRLLAAALRAGGRRRFTSFGAGDGDDDLGINAEKYLRAELQ